MFETLTNALDEVVGIMLAAALVYGAVVLFIRISGKRSTSQMNNFDWIVTVALGSLMATGILADSATFFEAIVAIASLLALQWIVTKSIYYSNRVTRIFKAEPTLLYAQGTYCAGAMRRERVTRAEIQAAIRENGFFTTADVRWVILETDATLSVIPAGNKQAHGEANIMSNVTGFDDQV